MKMSLRGGKYIGLAVDILNEAVKNLKGYERVDTYTHKDDQFGYEERPGQWNGLIGEVQNNVSSLVS